MDANYADLPKKLNNQIMKLGKASPNVMKNFMGLHQATMTNGALSISTKELIAVAIGIAMRCDGCIASHIQAALSAGASREEIIETIDVAILMGGGPSVVYGAKALEILNSLDPTSQTA